MLTKEEAARDALQFLESQTVGFVATVGLDGSPSVSPVYFVVLKDFSIYFSTSHHTEKFKNLTLNPKVAFSVGSGPAYTVVSIQGEAYATDEKERLSGMELIKAHVKDPLLWPIKAVKSLEEGGIALFKIKPKEIFFLNITPQNQLFTAPSNYFYQVLP